jgi:integrase/recombinase XerD
MLTVAADSYVTLRRSVGFGMRTIGPLVLDFARFADSIGDTHVKTQSAVHWAGRSRSPAQRETRMRAVIGFARHLHAEDSGHEVPPHGVFARMHTRRPTPYIFSPQQVRDLVAAAYRLDRPGSLRRQTYATLVSLLAVTGLRVSEALRLRLDDVTADRLIVRETKFHKSRLLPLHPTTAAGLARFRAYRDRYRGDLLFVHSDGRPLSYAVVAHTFNRLRRAAGISAKPRQPRPRLHCLRHTFAVRALEACPHDRTRIARHQVALVTYLGHAHVESTYRYLQATPDLLRDIAAQCESRATSKECR